MSVGASDIAVEVAAALREGRAIAPFSERGAALSVAEAYAVLPELRRRRGGARAGRKIGFTNRALWPRYNVDHPIWGDVLDTTLISAPAGAATAALSGFVEPRIEPEIVLGLGRAPSADMDHAALSACVDWIAPGFEVVQSIYPGWRFDAGDAIACGGLHGALIVGPRQPADAALLDALPAAAAALTRDGVEIETGRGANALDGPIHAFAHLVALLAADPHNPPLAAGEVVTTGTLTDAWPIAPGETWSLALEGGWRTRLETRFV